MVSIHIDAHIRMLFGANESHYDEYIERIDNVNLLIRLKLIRKAAFGIKLPFFTRIDVVFFRVISGVFIREFCYFVHYPGIINYNRVQKCGISM